MKGYVRCWDRREPPPRKLNAWDAGAIRAHVTCENGARETFPAGGKGRGGGLNTDQYSFPTDPYQGHARGQELATRDPRACRPVPANTGVVRRAQLALPDVTPRHQSTNQPILTFAHRTAAPTRQRQNPQDTARYGTRQAGKHEHQHRTTEPEQHPEAPMGSTGMHRGGSKGPCHRRGCAYDRHKRSLKYGRRTLRKTR